jgi:hypothetical protein
VSPEERQREALAIARGVRHRPDGTSQAFDWFLSERDHLREVLRPFAEAFEKPTEASRTISLHHLRQAHEAFGDGWVPESMKFYRSDGTFEVLDQGKVVYLRILCARVVEAAKSVVPSLDVDQIKKAPAHLGMPRGLLALCEAVKDLLVAEGARG